MRRHVVSLIVVLAAAIAVSIATTGSALAAASRVPAAASRVPAAGSRVPVTGSRVPAAGSRVPAVAAQARLSVSGTFTMGRDVVTVSGRTLDVQGIVRPYAPGQWVQVKSTVDGRVFKTDRLRIKPSRDAGAFVETVTSPRAGLVTVQVTHPATAQMLGFQAHRIVAALNPTGPGSRGPFVDLIQQRLVALHFYLPLSGVYDLQTSLAVDAYHRSLGRGTSQLLDAPTLADLLNGRGSFQVRDPHDGTHVEGDLADQLLAEINGSKVYRIYPISSGKPSTPTILGHFHVYARVPGYLPDGMYFSDFFYGGYAIHGYDPAPDYPASHGCMRLPISDALSVWNWLTYGVTVDVYQ